MSRSSKFHAFVASLSVASLVVIVVLLSLVTSSLSSFRFLSFVDAQCTTETELQFKLPAASDGIPSYISLPYGQGGTVYFETPAANPRPFPPIIVQTVESKSRKLEFTKEGSLVVCTASPPLRMGGSSVEINRGEALFDSLTILELLRADYAGEYTLNFTMTDKNTGRVYTIQSPKLSMVPRSDSPVAIRFRNSGFFTRKSSEDIPVNVPIPTWWIELVGRTGYAVPATQGATKYSVRLKPQFGSIVPDKQFDGAESIEFAGVAYVPPSDPVQHDNVSDSGVVFDFECNLGGAIGVVTLSTGTLTLVEDISRNRFIQLDPLTSYIRYENEGGTAVLGVPMPAIVIKLYTSQMGFDGSNTGLVILARSAQTTELKGAEALVIRGVATFADLTFVNFAPRSASITFSTILPSGRTGELFSGAIFVTDSAIKASRIRFADTSEISEQNAAYAIPAAPTGTSNQFKITLPTVRVLFVDSANRYDLTADRIELELSIDPPTYVFTETGTNKMTAVSDYGTVVWDKKAVTANAASNTTFSIRIADKTGIRSTLVSSKVTILDSTLSVAAQLGSCVSNAGNCSLKLKFLGTYGTRSSAVYAEDIAIFTTAGSTMPKIVVCLTDWFGPVYNQNRNIDITSSTFRVKAYTSDPNNEKVLDVSGVYGRFQNGLYIFECLRINAATGLVRINFVAETSGGLVFEGLGRPRTGFTTVLSSPISGYAVRFASSSLLQYGGQRTSGIVGVALPPIVLEVVDSQNQLDAADASVTVVATTSTGDTSSPVTAQKGLISFPLVQFLTASENPTITFTVTKSNNPVSGQSLASGGVQLTTLVIPFYEVAFDSDRNTQSQITSQFQSKSDITAWGEIRSILVIRDSAHETIQSLGSYVGAIQVDVMSDDADIGTPVAATFLPTCANRNYPCVDIRTRINGVRPNVGVPDGGPVYLKYRVRSGPALLVGQQLVAGPLSVAGTGASCGGAGGGSSAVVAEFNQSKSIFDTRVDSISADIAKALGVEAARVSIDRTTAKQVIRTDFVNLAEHLVTKVHISFLDPLPTSTIRKSRSDLQSEFLQVRPQCDLASLRLWAVYNLLQEKDCNPQLFLDGIQAAKTCTRSGAKPMCECYENGVVRDHGAVCANDPTLATDLVTMCTEIRSTCEDSGIQNLCSSVLTPKKSSMVWAWATLGAIGGLGIAGFVAFKKYQAKKKQKSGKKGLGK